MTRSTTLLAALALLPAFTSPARATSIERMDLDHVARTAPVVVVGTVTAIHTSERAGVSESILTVRVVNVLRGAAEGKEVRVQLRRSLVHFDPPQKVGDSGVFFLESSEGGVHRPVYPGSIAVFTEGPTAPRR
jgi:hypothetical protein